MQLPTKCPCHRTDQASPLCNHIYIYVCLHYFPLPPSAPSLRGQDRAPTAHSWHSLHTRDTLCAETEKAPRRNRPCRHQAIQNQICHELLVPRDPELFSSFPVTNCSLPSRSQFALPSLPLQVFYPPTIPWLRLHAHRPGGNTTYTQRKSVTIGNYLH